MANVFEQVDQIASEALMHLEDSLVITSMTARDKTADFNTTPDGYKVGDTVRIKTRPDYEAKEFAGAIERQEIRESKRTMSIEKHYDVSVGITAREMALDIESFSEQVVQPAAYRLAEKVDRYVGTKILKGAGLYASDDLFSNASDMALARKEANYQQLSPQSRMCLVNDELEAKLLGLDYFIKYDSRGAAGNTVFEEARMGRAMAMQFFTSLNFPEDTQTSVGNGTTQTDNGGGANNKIGVSTLTCDALSGQIEEGARIRVAGVRRPLIVASQVVATSTSIPLVDPITEIIPDNAAITVVGSGQTNLDIQGAIFDGNSLAVAMPVLDTPSDKPAFVASNNGVSIRVVQGYDMDSKEETMSLDLLIGAEAWDPRRITLLREY